MNITSITVSNFGLIAGPLTVDLQPGVNLIHGPNRTGKSTLVRAMIAALTHKATIMGDALREMQSNGEIPAVRLTLSTDDGMISIDKRYAGQRGTFTLTIEEKARLTTLAGAQADTRLFDMLGIKPPLKGVPDDKACGILPLVVIRQGDSMVDPGDALNDGARTTLHDLLQSQTQVAIVGADTERLIEKVKQRHDQYWTDTGALKAAAGSPHFVRKRTLEDSQTKLQSLHKLRNEHQNRIDDHASVSARLEALNRELPRCTTERDAAKDRVREIEKLKEHVKSADLQYQLASAEAVKAHEQLEQRKQLSSNLASSRAELEDSESTLAASQQRLEAAREEITKADAALASAQHEESNRAAVISRLQLIDRKIHAGTACEQAQSKLVQARKLSLAVDDATRDLAALCMPADAILRLRKLHTKAQTAKAKLEGAAAKVRITPLRPCTLRTGGDQRDLDANVASDHLVTAHATFEIADVAMVEVTPGGDSLATIKADALQAELALVQELAAINVADVAAAEAKEAIRVGLHAGLAQAKALRDQVAPDGIAALEADLADKQGAMKGIEEQLKAAAGDDVADDRPIDVRVAEARAAHEAALRLVNQKKADLKQLETRGADAATETASAKARVDERRNTLATAQQLLQADIAAVGSDEELQKRRLATANEATARNQSLDDATVALDSRKPEQAQADLDRCQMAVEQVEDDLNANQGRMDQLTGAMSATDVVGLHERIGDAEAAVNAARRDFELEDGNARAAKLLYDTLRNARDQAQAQLREPLMRKLQPLIQHLFPKAVLEVDDGFGLKSISRPDAAGITIEDPFYRLSGGEREQVSLAVRLALAQVFAERLKLPVIIDDGLVNTDPDRMKRALDLIQTVGRNHQIIICTCHPESYRGIDAARIDLQALIAKTAAAN